jgi:hypothetical protein
MIQNPEFIPGAQDEIYSGNIGDLLRLQLSVATGHNHPDFRVVPQCMPDCFSTFAICKISDGARIQHKNVRGFIFFYDVVATRPELLRQA